MHLLLCTGAGHDERRNDRVEYLSPYDGCFLCFFSTHKVLLENTYALLFG